MRILFRCIASPSRGLRHFTLELCPGPVTDVDGGNLDLYAGAERYRRVLDKNVVVAGPVTDIDGGNFNLYAGAERCRRVLDKNIVVAGPLTDDDGGNLNLHADAERCLHLRWDLLHAEFV